MTSKGIGIVRRIDDLGRVVIPMEVRKSFHIGTNEPLEIFVDGSDTVVLRKYHSQPDVQALAQEYADTLYKTFSHAILVSDSDTIIAVAGLSKKEYLNKPIPDELQLSDTSGLIDITPSEQFSFSQVLVDPVPLGAGVPGRFMMLARNRGEINVAETKSLQAATLFIRRWMEKNSSKR